MTPGLENAIMARKGRRAGDEIRFCCPVHEDASPSASYNAEKRCWSCQGCGASGGEKSLCEALGVDWVHDPALRSERPTLGQLPPGIPPRMGTLEAGSIHCYRDASSEVIGYAVRYDGSEGKKVFPFFRRARDEWRSAAPKAPRTMYNVQRLAARPDDVVWVVEGEKCADALVRLGLLAVTSQGGSKAASKTDWAPIHGRHVVIWPDADEPGAGYARTVRGLLRGGQVDQIDPAAVGCTGQGEDCVDWMDRHPSPTREDVEALPRVTDPTKRAEVVAAGDSTWTDGLERNAQGAPKSTDGNLYRIFANDPAWVGKFGWNARSLKVIALAENVAQVPVGKPLLDFHSYHVADWLYQCWQMPRPSATSVLPAIGAVSMACSFDPVRDWLESLEWDGKPRVDSWLESGAGVRADEYSVAVGANFLVSAVARAMDYGCKVDTVPVFCGRQGTLKSQMLAALMEKREWLTESFLPSMIGNKDSLMLIHGPWFVEIQELDGLGKREASTTKGFLSTSTDRFRHPYARITEDHGRSNVFAGTVNPDVFLIDPTGNRRYWPVTVKQQTNLDWIAENRGQLWAESVVRYRGGAQWWMSPVMERVASARQDAYRAEDPWESRVREWIIMNPGQPLCATMIVREMTDGSRTEDPKAASRARGIMQILANEGWEREETRRRIGPAGAHHWYQPPIRAVDGEAEPKEKPEPMAGKGQSEVTFVY